MTEQLKTDLNNKILEARGWIRALSYKQDVQYFYWLGRLEGLENLMRIYK